MSFKQKYTDALEEMIPKEHDDYKEIQYNDTLFVHVWSHDDGEGYFEISVVVPHEHTDGYDFNAETLSMVPETESLYNTLKQLTEEFTGEEYPNFVFHHTETVEEGIWPKAANLYETFKLYSE